MVARIDGKNLDVIAVKYDTSVVNIDLRGESSVKPKEKRVVSNLLLIQPNIGSHDRVRPVLNPKD